MVTDAMVQRALLALYDASHGDLHASTDEMRAALEAALQCNRAFAHALPGNAKPEASTCCEVMKEE